MEVKTGEARLILQNLCGTLVTISGSKFILAIAEEPPRPILTLLA